jgi:3-oxoacyl-[acyl-carrier-protein] synthase II
MKGAQMNSAYQDAVITGLAAISPAGVGIPALSDALSLGESFLKAVPEGVVDGLHLWGKADAFRAADYMAPLKARKFDRCSLFTVVAAGMALRDAGFAPGSFDAARIGIVIGSGFAGISNSEEFLRGYFRAGTEGMVPMLFPNVVPNASASNASIEHGLKGPNVTIIQRFCSAESAFLLARRFLEEDRADVILTGGVDEVTPLMLRGFGVLGQLRSFGSGFGEGAGILVLERGDHARRRQAKVLAGVGQIRTIGRLASGAIAEGVNRLLPDPCEAGLVALSGTASREKALLDRLPAVPRLETGAILGCSLAMGGLAMTSLVLRLATGEKALYLAASPEGPFYAIDWLGGDPVQS